MSSSSDEECNDYPRYRDRPEWKDVQPITQDDGEYPVVAIAYSDQYQDVYDYFRGIVVRQEKSERALQLCIDALTLNPANYTVWHYRRQILRHLNSDLMKEIEYISEVIGKHPKNYQVWHHRRVIVGWQGDGSLECPFTEEMLRADAKNYHAWQHRQWALSKFKMFDGELEFTERLLEDDVRNNSVWNHRFFVFSSAKEQFSNKIADREIDFVITKLRIALYNESVWNYARGILLHCDSDGPKAKLLKFCYDIYEKGDNGEHSIYLFMFLADNAVEDIENGCGDINTKTTFATKLYSELALKYDVIRASYWNFIIQDLHHRFPASFVK
ncbi:hypothetical protein V9T40_013280 [Parthenolecanium corni]|uniref:Protein farnesyltransferase/geranylgeranyltransferase type-1 subunit alpha n=1 Tax=Parthenolecanium corni TaxID=536013 RepID=A0AAN9Y712_9HEMI